MNKQKVFNHIEHLREKHEEIDKRLKRAVELHSNDFIITTLKKEKLHLKDEIQKLSNDYNTV